MSDELADFLKATPHCQFIEVLVPDMNGMLRGKRLGTTEFDKLFGEGINHCGAAVVMNTKGDTFDCVPYGAHDGDPDVHGRAVPGSLVPLPWTSVPAGQVLLELFEVDGAPFFPDPRHVLRHAMKPLSDMGLHPVIATELEFYLVEHDGNRFQPRRACMPGSGLPQRGLQFGSLEDLLDVDPFLMELVAVCETQKIPAGTALSEFAPGQFSTLR